MSEIVSFVAYLLTSALMGAAFVLLARRSPAGVVVALTESIFVAAICIYPILFYLGVIDPGPEGSYYLRANGEPGMGAALHIVMFACGALIGAWTGVRMGGADRAARRMVRFSQITVPKQWQWLLVVMAGVAGYALFIYLVGFWTAIGNAATERGGDVEGFGADAKWLFLKTLSNAFIYLAVAIFPFMMSKGRKAWLFIFLYLLLVAFAFVNAISRNMILAFVITPWFAHLISGAYKGRLSFLRVFARPRVLLGMAVLGFIGVFILIYGKSIGHSTGSYSQGRAQGLQSNSFDTGNPLTTFLVNSEFAWYSTDAGISHAFSDSAPMLPRDIAIAPVGFIPVRVMAAIGLDGLSGETLRPDQRMACINTTYFPGAKACTIPPRFIGYSAYFFPFAGAFLLGFLQFLLYGRMAELWRRVRLIGPQHTWVPYFCVITIARLTSMVPGGISQTVFVLCMLLGWFSLRFSLIALSRRFSLRAMPVRPASAAGA